MSSIIVFSSKSEESARNAARTAEAALRAFIGEIGEDREALELRAMEAPIALLRGEHRWQVFLKLYFKANSELIAGRMRKLAEEAPPDVRAELEINPVNMV